MSLDLSVPLSMIKRFGYRCCQNLENSFKIVPVLMLKIKAFQLTSTKGRKLSVEFSYGPRVCRQQCLYIVEKRKWKNGMESVMDWWFLFTLFQNFKYYILGPFWFFIRPHEIALWAHSVRGPEVENIYFRVCWWLAMYYHLLCWPFSNSKK